MPQIVKFQKPINAWLLDGIRTRDAHWVHGCVVVIVEGDQLGQRKREHYDSIAKVSDKFTVKAFRVFLWIYWCGIFLVGLTMSSLRPVTRSTHRRGVSIHLFVFVPKPLANIQVCRVLVSWFVFDAFDQRQESVHLRTIAVFQQDDIAGSVHYSQFYHLQPALYLVTNADLQASSTGRTSKYFPGKSWRVSYVWEHDATNVSCENEQSTKQTQTIPHWSPRQRNKSLAHAQVGARRPGRHVPVAPSTVNCGCFHQLCDAGNNQQSRLTYQVFSLMGCRSRSKHILRASDHKIVFLNRHECKCTGRLRVTTHSVCTTLATTASACICGCGLPVDDRLSRDLGISRNSHGVRLACSFAVRYSKQIWNMNDTEAVDTDEREGGWISYCRSYSILVSEHD